MCEEKGGRVEVAGGHKQTAERRYSEGGVLSSGHSPDLQQTTDPRDILCRRQWAAAPSSDWLQCVLLGKWCVTGAPRAACHRDTVRAQAPFSSPCAAPLLPPTLAPPYWSPIRPLWECSKECKYPPAFPHTTPTIKTLRPSICSHVPSCISKRDATNPLVYL